MPPPPPPRSTAAPTATATADLAQPPQLVDPYEARVPDAHLRSLQTAVTELSRPLPPRRIAAVVAQATTEALNPQAVVVAFHEDDGLDLRSAHVAGLPYLARRRICGRPVPAPDLVGEIERFLSSAGPGP